MRVAVHSCALVLALVACKGTEQKPAAPPPGSAAPVEPATGAAVVAAVADAPVVAEPTFVEGKDYLVLQRVRFMDEQGFEQPAEAFSVLLPKGWTHEGGIQWKGLQECRGELVTAAWSAASADGAIKLVSLPMRTWGSAADRTMQQILSKAALAGGCATGGVKSAEAYLREDFAPQELTGAEIVEVTTNEAAVRELDQQAERTQVAIAQYGGTATIENSAVVARLRWADGSEGIALTSVTNMTSSAGGRKVGTMSMAAERSFLRFPAARKAEAEQVLATAKASLRTNPAWKRSIDEMFAKLRTQQDQIHRQRMAAIDANTRAMTAAHNQRMRDIAAAGAANTARHEDRMAAMDGQVRSWEAQQDSQDRMHRSFVETIREVETYQDAGGTVELTGGYEQAWSRGDGTYILSNTPGFDPSRVFQDQSWKQIEKAAR